MFNCGFATQNQGDILNESCRDSDEEDGKSYIRTFAREQALANVEFRQQAGCEYRLQKKGLCQGTREARETREVREVNEVREVRTRSNKGQYRYAGQQEEEGKTIFTRQASEGHEGQTLHNPFCSERPCQYETAIFSSHRVGKNMTLGKGESIDSDEKNTLLGRGESIVSGISKEYFYSQLGVSSKQANSLIQHQQGPLGQFYTFVERTVSGSGKGEAGHGDTEVTFSKGKIKGQARVGGQGHSQTQEQGLQCKRVQVGEMKQARVEQGHITQYTRQAQRNQKYQREIESNQGYLFQSKSKEIMHQGRHQGGLSRNEFDSSSNAKSSGPGRQLMNKAQEAAFQKQMNPKLLDSTGRELSRQQNLITTDSRSKADESNCPCNVYCANCKFKKLLVRNEPAKPLSQILTPQRLFLHLREIRHLRQRQSGRCQLPRHPLDIMESQVLRSDLQQQMALAASEIEQLTRDRVHFEKQVLQQQARAKSLEESLQKTKTRLQAQLLGKSTVQKDLEECRQALSYKVSLLEETEKDCAKLGKKCSAFSQLVEDLTGQLKSKESIVASTQKSHSEQSKKLREVISQRDSQTVNLRSEIGVLEGANFELRSRVKDLELSLGEQEKDRQELNLSFEGILKGKKDELARLSSQYKQLQEQSRASAEQLERLRTSQSSSEQQAWEERRKLEASEQQLRFQLNELRVQFSRQGSESQTARSENDRLRSAKRELQYALEQLKAGHKAELELRLNQLQHSLTSSFNEQRLAKESSFRKQMQSIEDSSSKARKSLEMQLKELSMKYERLAQSKRQHSQQSDELSLQLAELAAQLRQSQAYSVELEQKCRGLQESEKSLRCQFSLKQSECNDLRQRLECFELGMQEVNEELTHSKH